jgi:hypothetical protein
LRFLPQDSRNKSGFDSGHLRRGIYNTPRQMCYIPDDDVLEVLAAILTGLMLSVTIAVDGR